MKKLILLSLSCILSGCSTLQTEFQNPQSQPASTTTLTTQLTQSIASQDRTTKSIGDILSAIIIGGIVK